MSDTASARARQLDQEDPAVRSSAVASVERAGLILRMFLHGRSLGGERVVVALKPAKVHALDLTEVVQDAWAPFLPSGEAPPVYGLSGRPANGTVA